MPVVTLQKTNSVTLDTIIQEQSPTSPGGSDNYNYVGKGASPTALIRSLLKFDLGLIPNNAIINSAQLYLYKNDSIGGVLNAHKATSAWDNSTTWNTSPSFDPSASSSLTLPTSSGTVALDIKSLVQEWVNGISVNNGLLLKKTDETTLNTQTAFGSFDHPTVGWRPTLTIDYTIPTTGKKQVEYVGKQRTIDSNSITSKVIVLPAGAASGDLAVITIALGNNVTLTKPADWTQLRNQTLGGKFGIFYKFIGTSEPNPVFTFGSSPIYANAYLFRNVKDIDAIVNTTFTSTSSMAPMPVTTTKTNTLLVGFGVFSFALPDRLTPALSYEELAEDMTGSTTNAAFQKYLHNKTSETTQEQTFTTSTSTSGIYTTLALEPIANNPPTLSLTSPADNQSLTEGSTLQVKGSVTDLDNGDVVTVWYKVNNGTAQAAASSVSDGSTPISFAKDLTYKNKRVYLGAADITGADLAENTDHTLTVWAEDNKGGKSADAVRKFRVIWNRPPVISGIDGNLGTMEAPPEVTYSVSDPESNSFTVTEKINGTVIRTFAGVADRQEKITVPADKWLELEPSVQHTLTIEATDNQGMKSTRTYTLMRFVDAIYFDEMDFATLDAATKTFFTTDVAAKRLLLTPVWDLPPGVNLLVEATNNAYDVAPTWEDATIPVKLNRAHIFSNAAKTATKWGINFRFKIEKGTAIGPVYFKGIGGAFD